MRIALIRQAGWRRGGPERWLAVAALLALTTAVLGTAPDPAISAIEVVPAEIMVDPTRPGTLELAARLWSGPAANRKSITADSGPALVWTLSPTPPWLTVLSTAGYRVTLQINPGTTLPVPVTVRVSTGAWSAEGHIVPVTNSVLDIAEAAPTDRMPAAVITRGIRNAVGDPCTISLVAFVRTAVVGRLVGECDTDAPTWGAAILDPTRAMALLPGRWTPKADTADVSPVQEPVRSLPVALRIVVGGTGNLDSLRAAVKAIALADMQGATSTLAENRVGVGIEVVDTVVVTSSGVPTLVTNCISGDALTPAGDRAGTLHVFYVNSMGGLRGLMCAGTNEHPQPAIFVAWQNGASSTLVHEVGHALGLTLPRAGHSDKLPGLDATNVMRSGDSDQDPAGRHRLTVGQVFRMNADSGSWLNRAEARPGTLVREASAPRLACQCGGKDPEGLCPRLADDLGSHSGSAGTYNDWDCHDLLRLPIMVPDQAPVGVLAGLRWRVPIGSCVAAVSEQRADHWEANYLQFDNFTRPGSCPAWAAVFFKGHRPLYRDLTEDRDLPWSDAAEEWQIIIELDTLAPEDLPPLSVSVRLHYPASAKARVDADTAELVKVFGDDNRTGIKLTFSRNPDVDCPTGTGPATAFTICYGPQSGPANQANGPIRVSAAAATPFTVSHLLGQAFGLSPLPPEALNDPSFAENVMQPAPGKRGDRLTLGQVFRLNMSQGWGPGTCTPPDACPPLDLDVAP